MGHVARARRDAHSLELCAPFAAAAVLGHGVVKVTGGEEEVFICDPREAQDVFVVTLAEAIAQPPHVGVVAVEGSLVPPNEHLQDLGVHQLGVVVRAVHVHDVGRGVGGRGVWYGARRASAEMTAISSI